MATQPKIFEMPNFFQEQRWALYGKYLGAHGASLDKKSAELAEQCGWFMWDMGDWLLEGENGELPTRKLKKYAQEVCPNRKWKTLENWKVTSRAIEPSRRRDGREGRRALSYSLHKEVEKFEPEDQESMLQHAVDERIVKVRHLRAVIKSEQQIGRLPRPTKDRQTVASKPLNLKVSAEFYNYLYNLAWMRFGNRHPKRMLWWMVGQYLKEHKADLDSEYEAFSKQTPEERNAHWDKVSKQEHAGNSGKRS